MKSSTRSVPILIGPPRRRHGIPSTFKPCAIAPSPLPSRYSPKIRRTTGAEASSIAATRSRALGRLMQVRVRPAVRHHIPVRRPTALVPPLLAHLGIHHREPALPNQHRVPSPTTTALQSRCGFFSASSGGLAPDSGTNLQPAQRKPVGAEWLSNEHEKLEDAAATVITSAAIRRARTTPPTLPLGFTAIDTARFRAWADTAIHGVSDRFRRVPPTVVHGV